MADPASGDPLEILQQRQLHPPRRRPLQRVRVAGLLVAWLGAVACGWNVFQATDLLDAVLRGAAAWVGFTVLWMMAVSACERLIVGAETAHRSRLTAHGEDGSGRAAHS
jgi:hypothetical protein